MRSPLAPGFATAPQDGGRPATVHLAELPTTLLSGLARWWFGNVQGRALVSLVVPGAMGAWAGARLLGNLPGEPMRPYVSAVLFVLGAYILLRFSIEERSPRRAEPAWRKRLAGAPACAALAMAAGFIDAVAGGVVAALLAAWLVARLPARILGTAVGGLVMATHTPRVLTAFGLAAPHLAAVRGALGALWAGCAWRAWRGARASRRAAERAALRLLSRAVAAPGPWHRAGSGSRTSRVSRWPSGSRPSFATAA